MKVSFGIINYNRLFYLKSCAESLMESVGDYSDVEFICIDDNSKEDGTKEYLQTLKDRGWTVINQENHRQSSKQDIGAIKQVIDEFSAALNLFNETATGDLIVPLQGDMQFVRKDWIDDYVELFEESEDVFAVMLDAQRRIRLNASNYTDKRTSSNNSFAVHLGRAIPGSGDCMYRKEDVDHIGGWHTGESDNAEDIFTNMVDAVFYGKKKVFVPWKPVSIGIFTDPRGTNGRVRGNKRYGVYWEALKDNLYYDWIPEEKFSEASLLHRPLSIEELAAAHGNWSLPIDSFGNWKKNPINWPVEDNVPFEVIT